MNKRVRYIMIIVLLLIAGYIIYNNYSKNTSITEQQKMYEEAHAKIQNAWNGKTLTYPSELYDSQTNQIVDLDSKLENNSKKYTLISYLDGDCSSCVQDLKNWEVLLQEHPILKKELNLQFIISSSDIELLKYLMYDKAKSPFDFLWDKNNQFKKQNKVSDLKAYQTFLLRNETVVFVGSPIRGDFYIDRLKEIIADTN